MAYKFVNPYNFIPLEKEEPKRYSEDKGQFTGVIRYSLLTKTPLFIPNTSSDDAFKLRTGKLKEALKEHKSLDFFSYTDLSENEESTEGRPTAPVIPGSEMRGLFRSYFEILTNSCLSAAEDDSENAVLSKRTQEKFLPGLLHKKADNSFELFMAEDYLVRTLGANSLADDKNWKDDNSHNGRKCYIQNSIKEGQKVTFEPGIRPGRGVKPIAENIDPSCKTGSKWGYFLKGEDGPEMTKKENDASGNEVIIILKQQKHCGHIFRLKTVKAADNVDISVLTRLLGIYEQNGQSLYKEYSEELEKFMKAAKTNDYFPVYYSSAVKGFYMLSPACITREIYKNNIRKMLRKHASCSEQGKLCPACRLFGTVVNRQDDSFSVASRVRFSDLSLAKPFNADKTYLPIVTLKELSSPKLGNLEFYVKRPENAQFWTYDYYYLLKGTDAKEYIPEINGRKFYWHQNIGDSIPSENTEKMPAPEMEDSELDKYKRNMTIRPLRKNVEFAGEIYFTDLTKKELNQLIYTVNCGEESSSVYDRAHGYKLGAGKPYGLGSIATAVQSVQLVDYSIDSKKKVISRDIKPYSVKYECPDCSQDLQENFLKMTAFDTVKNTAVSYPYLQKPGSGEDNYIYDWFTANHQKYDRKKDCIMLKKMPNSRSEMVYGTYLEPMEPCVKPIIEGKGLNDTSSESSGKDYSSEREDKNSSRPKNGKKANAVWIGSYGVSPEQKKSLEVMYGAKIFYDSKENRNLDLLILDRLAEDYEVLMVPAISRLDKNSDLLKKAKERFKAVYQSVSKKTNKRWKDYDWIKL